MHSGLVTGECTYMHMTDILLGDDCFNLSARYVPRDRMDTPKLKMDCRSSLIR